MRAAASATPLTGDAPGAGENFPGKILSIREFPARMEDLRTALRKVHPKLEARADTLYNPKLISAQNFQKNSSESNDKQLVAWGFTQEQ